MIILCGLAALLDGFDLLAIGVVAPAMAGPLHIAPNQFGFLFSYGNLNGRPYLACCPASAISFGGVKQRDTGEYLSNADLNKT